MKKNKLGKRIIAFVTAVMLTVITPLSYSGYSLFGASAKAQNSMNYMTEINVKEGTNDDVIVSWEYLDESKYADLEVGTYGVQVIQGGGESQIIGNITVMQEEPEPEETTTTEEETTTTEEETTTTEEETTTTEEETTTTEEETTTTEEETIITEEKTATNIETITTETASSEDAIVESASYEAAVSDTSSVSVEEPKRETYELYAMKLDGSHPSKDPDDEEEDSEDKVPKKIVTIEGTSNTCSFQGAKKKDASYTLCFVQYNENKDVIKEIERLESPLEYKAICTLSMKKEGSGHVDFAGKQYLRGDVLTIDNLKFDRDHRFIHIIPENNMWRLDEEALKKNIVGAKISKTKGQVSRYDISEVTGDIHISVKFIEKLQKPEQETGLEQETTLSTDETNPTVFSSPFYFKIKEKADTVYWYTIDGTDPKDNKSAKAYSSEGIRIEDYATKFVIKMYAKEEGKDDSDVISWYGKIIPSKPSIKDKADFPAEHKFEGTDYITTYDGTTNFVIEHPQGDKEKFWLEFGIVGNGSENWSLTPRYDNGSYKITLPSDLKTGNYEFKARYQTKGANFSEVSSIKNNVKIDNDVPTTTVDATMVLQNGQKQKLTSPAWVGNQVQFSLTGKAVSSVKSYEVSTDGTNYEKIENKGGIYTLPIEDIAEGDTNYYFRSTSYVNRVGAATEKFVLKKDTTAPEALKAENIVMEYLTDSPEDVGNKIYSNKEIKIKLQDTNSVEKETNSKLTVVYRIDRIDSSGGISKGQEQIWSGDPITLNTMGRYEFCVWYRDEAGNNAAEYKQALCYDNQDALICSEPRFELKGDRKETGYADYKFFAKNTLTLRFSAKDEHSGLSRVVIKNGDTVIRQEKLNGTTEETTFEIGVSEEGKYQLNVELYDKIGRKVSLSSEVGGFIIDQSGPDVQITGGSSEQEWQKEDINLTFQAMDNGSGIAKGMVTLNGKLTEQVANSYQESLTMQVTANEEAENSEGYLLKVEAFNNTGETQTKERKILLDKTAPVITVGGIEPASVNQTVPNLQIKVVEKIYNLATVNLIATRSIDGETSAYSLGDFTCSSVETNQQYDFPQDGVYEVSVEAKDKAGNQAEKQSINFTVDTTAPEIELNGPADASFQSKDATVEVKVTESFYDTNTVTIQATKTMDGKTEPYALEHFANTGKVSSMNYHFTEDGTYRIEVSAKDKAGNVSETKELTFSVDKTAPEVSIDGIENYHVTDQATNVTIMVTESFYASNNVSVSVKKEDVTGNTSAFPLAPFQSNAKVSHMNYQFKEEGIYTISVSATDEAGNTAETEKIVTIDTSYPVIQHMDLFDGKYLQEFSLGYSVDDMIQDFTIADYKMTLNGDLYSGETINAEGKYVFLVEVTDEVNHRSEAKAEFIIDNTAPEIIFIGAEDGQKSYEPIPVTVRLNESDDVLEKVSINGELQTLGEDNKTFKTVLNKMDTYQVEVASEDLAKNKAVKSITVKYTEKPFYVKIYENKPAFYGTVAAGATAIVGGGIALVTVTGGVAAGGVAAGGAGAGTGTSGNGLIRKLLRFFKR